MTETIFDIAETIHVPHPGSRTDAVNQDAQQHAAPTMSNAEPLATEQYLVPVMERAAIFGAYSSWAFAGTEASTYRILPRDDTRARAYVSVSGTGPVYIGTSKDALLAIRANGFPTSGQVLGVSVLQAGIVLPVSHQEGVFVIPDGSHSAVVSVAAERWATNPVT
jgi:hypothetical protein